MGLLPRRRGIIVRLFLLIPLFWIVSLVATSFIRNSPSHPVKRTRPKLPVAQPVRHEVNEQSAVDQNEWPRPEHFAAAPVRKVVVQQPAAPQQENDNDVMPNIARPLEPQKPRVMNNPNDPGEGGKAVVVDKLKLSPPEREKYDTGWMNNAFNEYVSNKISVHRSLKDARDSECIKQIYPKQLPDTSVIVCFHNEAWSVLLRTVHSILDRSPEHLIREIILVDDFSSRENLKKPLDTYMAKIGKVRVVRSKKREGLIRARLLGASVASGAVLTYLDSHCECTEGWLEPLLARIALNESNVVCPVIDVIDENTFHFNAAAAKFTSLGGFDWNLQFSWHSIPDSLKRSGRRDIDPLPSPTMAGGLFSISRKYFEYLGSYDPGMDIWGGENLELSFRVWMCGGRLEIVPCSHVGHIFRKRSPYSWGNAGNAVRKNSVRLAEVWLDDHKKYYYQRFNYDLGNYGDVSSRKALRKRLKCKSFQWYLDTIYPYLFIPSKAVYSGEIRNMHKPMCVDAQAQLQNHVNVKMWPCHNQGGNQYWMMSEGGEIRRDEVCLDYDGRSKVITYGCHGLKGNQHWEYNKMRHIRHVVHDVCMEMSPDGKTLIMAPCTDTDRQVWMFPLNKDELRKKRSAS